jgi:hypothetical protein
MNTNEIVTQSEFTQQLVEFEKIQDVCRKLMSTRHYQAFGESGIHAIIARAKALGIHPFEALNGGFYCINGKVGMSTEMMAALVRKRGHSITKDPKSDNEICILHGKRSDSGDTWTCTFSKQDALTAGLWNGTTWKKYPGIMLYNRCMSMLFRQLFPDLSLGAGYVEDELKEIAKVDEYKLPVAECEDVTHVQFTLPVQEEIIKYISKSQLKMFNEKYDQIASSASPYYDENKCKILDQAIIDLNIEGFPSLEKMKEKDWTRFMKSFEKTFAEKKIA